MSNKKLIFVLGVIFIIFIIIFLFPKKTNNKGILNNLKETDKSLTSDFLVKKISEEDKDKDGLKDWEEILWKTDPNNKDTDGDGTNDNEEVLKNRDPLKKGPNDVIKKLVINKGEFEKKDENLNDTEDVAKDLLLGYLSLKQSNLLDQNNQEALIISILNDKFNNNLENKYSEKDIKIVYKDDIETLSLYGDNLMKILNKYPEDENDLIVLERIIEKNKNEDIEKLKKSADLYVEIKEKMLSLQVPYKISSNHINILNAIEKITNNVKGMIYVSEDPVKVLINVNGYVENEEIIINEFAEIGTYLKSKNILLNI